MYNIWCVSRDTGLDKTNESQLCQMLFSCAFSFMAVRVVEFSSRGTTLEIFLHKNQHTQRKLLNFEFWINGELSKIGYHFSKAMKLYSFAFL